MDNNSNSNEKAKSKKHFKILTRTPWSDFQEWKNCYNFLFSNAYGISGKKIDKVSDTVDLFIDGLDFSNLQKAFNILSIWNSRFDNNTYILATLLLLEEILKFNSGSYLHFNMNDKKHILSQKIIRVTNLIIDNLKKKDKNIASNMFLVAKEINLPEFIIEIRHICTHKNLPDLNTLVFAVKYLYFWLKANLWDKQYDYFLKESKSKEKIFEILNELENAENKNSFNNAKIKLEGIEAIGKGKSSAVKFKFEIKNLVEIINSLVQKFCKFCVFSNNGKVYNEKIKELGLIFDFLFKIEGELFIILLYKYISDFAFYEIAMKILLEAECEENTFKFAVNKIVDENKRTFIKFKFLSFFIQKYLSNKGQFASGTKREFVIESFENQILNSNKKDKKVKPNNYLSNNNPKNLNFTFLLNSIFDLLKFSQDFSIEIRGIYDMFFCNFKQYCEAFSANSDVNSTSAIFLDEKTFGNSFLGIKRKRLEQDTDKDRNLADKPSGSLIFRQLEIISSGNLKKENIDFENEEKNKITLNTDYEQIQFINENEDENYNFTYMDKRLRKIIEKENKNKLLKLKEEEENSIRNLNGDCFIIDLKNKK